MFPPDEIRTSSGTILSPIVSPVLADITNEIRPILVEVLTGSTTVEDGMARMQAAAEAIAG